jgi:dihydrofolate reductase
MRKLVVSEWLTLDGVFDADTMEQWFNPFDSESRKAFIVESVLGCDAMLLGRTTYEMFAAYWPLRKNNEDGLADKLNSVPKYVVSSTLKKVYWNNTKIIAENVVEEIARLKAQPGREIQIEGSATLVQALMGTDLIDEYRFLVHPVIAGSGKRFFKEGMHTAGLKLVRTKKLDLGVNMLCYQRAAAGTGTTHVVPDRSAAAVV